jgi:hypothetical protein
MRYTNFSWRYWAGLLVLLSCGIAFSQTGRPDSLKAAVLYSLKKGRQIRVEKSDGSINTGKLLAVKDDSLWLGAGSAKTMAIALSDLQTLWVRTNSAREGGRVGAILGAIPGVIAGSSLAGLANLDCETHCVDLNFPRFIGGLIGGIVGAAGGAAIGSSIGVAIPQWQRQYP